MKQNKFIIAITCLTVMFFSRANAADTTVEITPLPVELRYAGIVKNQPLIQLNFSGTASENIFTINITDESGITLYSADVKGEIFTKQFLLNTDDLGDAVLQFEIIGKKSGKKAVYRLTRQQEITEQMDVVKL